MLFHDQVQLSVSRHVNELGDVERMLVERLVDAFRSSWLNGWRDSERGNRRLRDYCEEFGILPSEMSAELRGLKSYGMVECMRRWVEV